MSITDNDRRKFKDYMEKRDLDSAKVVSVVDKKLVFEDEGNLDPIHWFAKDITLKKNDKLASDYYGYYQYILVEALAKLSQVMTKEEGEFVEEILNPYNIHAVLLLLLDNLEYYNTFISGALIGYAKLCISYKIEPNESFVGISIYTNWLKTHLI